MLNFLRSFVNTKGKQLGRDFVQALVEFDPDSATQAQLDQMERDLDQAGGILQKIRTDYDREVREAEAAEKRYNQMLAAAEHLQGKLDVAADGDKPGIEASLARLITQLEEFAPEVEQERQDVVEVKALLDEAQEAYRIKAQDLTSAKQKLDRARHDMQRATMQQERAEEKARRAAEVAGLRGNSTNKLTVAVDAMQRRADEARAKSEAAHLKASTLTRLTQSTPSGDANIAEAMRAVEGTGRVGGLSDRLAALKGPSTKALPKQ
ncbi:MAG: hypothetical protein GC191_20620 [Azospirillum sp.]|nr:hypothetical protein [Azospirillum sp.]